MDGAKRDIIMASGIVQDSLLATLTRNVCIHTALLLERLAVATWPKTLLPAVWEAALPTWEAFMCTIVPLPIARHFCLAGPCTRTARPWSWDRPLPITLRQPEEPFMRRVKLMWKATRLVATLHRKVEPIWQETLISPGVEMMA